MTIQDKLKDYENNPSFCEAYMDCKPIEEIEGEIIEDGKFCGYALSDKYGNRWFTDYGIRGIEEGTFKVVNGNPKRIIKQPNYDTLMYIAKLLRDKTDISQFTIYEILKKNWYENQ